MSILRLRLPREGRSLSAEATRTFFVRSEFSGEVNKVISDQEYAHSVALGQTFLSSDSTRKIVLSRILSFPHTGITAESLFNKFNTHFPNAAVFYFEDEHNNHWLGATPELLFRKRGENYQTISLAGTRKTGTTEDWGDKEIDEQQLVTEFILSELNTIGATNIQCSPRHTWVAGSVEHLCTDIEFQYTGPWNDVMKRLHPTPAICGMPRDASKNLIQQIELHDREYYTGLIGAEQGSNVDVYVILRCLKLTEEKLLVFVGAGITQNSEPSEEARETRWKAESLTNVIF